MMGGSFDPVHIGHISFVRDVLNQLQMDEVVFMPAKLQPFKLDIELSSFVDRLNMLKLAIKNEPGMRVSPLENQLPGVSYTHRTLQEFKKDMDKNSKLYFMVGTDTFVQMDTWKEPERLLRDNAIIVANRPGYDEEKILLKKSEYEKKFGSEIILVENKEIYLSSTDIRKKVIAGEPLTDMVHRDVEAYIKEKGLYRS